MQIVIVGVVLAGCGSEGEVAGQDTSSSAPASCVIPPSDTATGEGWIGYVDSHRDDVSLVLTEGDETTLDLRGEEPMPTASAAKLIHLAVYAELVSTGVLNPNQTVRLEEWDRWYLPADGGAHIAALDELRIDHDELGFATDPTRTVTLEQMMRAMIAHSDSAAPDFLRSLVGDDPFRTVMARYAISGEPPTMLGLYLSLVDSAVSYDDSWTPMCQDLVRR